MVALPGWTPDHHLPDSERILRTFGAWHESATIQEAPEFQRMVDFAIQAYSRGAGRIRVRWALRDEFGGDRRIGQAQARAEAEILKAEESTPAPFKRALVAIQRQEAIQGAIAAGMWGPALAGLARAGEVAGELDREVGLGPDDLRLVVEIEGDVIPLPPAEGEPLETSETLAAETSETEAGRAETGSD